MVAGGVGTAMEVRKTQIGRQNAAVCVDRRRSVSKEGAAEDGEESGEGANSRQN
jgi:hypothetical protein